MIQYDQLWFVELVLGLDGGPDVEDLGQITNPMALQLRRLTGFHVFDRDSR